MSSRKCPTCGETYRKGKKLHAMAPLWSFRAYPAEEHSMGLCVWSYHPSAARRCEYTRFRGPNGPSIAFTNYCKRCWNTPSADGTTPRQRAHAEPDHG